MKRSHRADLVYRNMTHQGDSGPLDEITHRVLAFLARTEVDDWTPEHWRSYQILIQANSRSPIAPMPTNMEMRRDALRTLLGSIGGDEASTS